MPKEEGSGSKDQRKRKNELPQPSTSSGQTSESKRPKKKVNKQINDAEIHFRSTQQWSSSQPNKTENCQSQFDTERGNVLIEEIQLKSLNNNFSIVSKAKRSLIQELDAIDTEFDNNLNKEQRLELVAPDGIQIVVDRREDDQFPDELDYDEEVVVPIQDREVDSDAETLPGEEYNLNESFSSSTIITFNGNHGDKNLCSTAVGSDFSGKRIQDMTPDELMDANLALKQLMEKLIEKKN